MKDGIQSVDDARARGREAREAGKPRASCPLRRYPSKALRDAWLEGWDSALVVQQIEVKVQQVEAKTRGGEFWPKDKPMPDSYEIRKKPELPCPSCRRVRLDNEGQAVLVKSTTQGMAYLWCRGCNHKFKMSVVVV